MAPSKSVSDVWRTGLIKSSSAILAPIEDRLERSGNQEKAQRLRKLQHRLFGLTKTQWACINDLISAEEAICAIAQADEQATKRLAKLRSLPPVDDAAEVEHGAIQTGISRIGFGTGVLELEAAAVDPVAAAKSHEKPQEPRDALATVH
ncbi:hypothetical protein HFD88_005624 [Aspergillus terreus]|nr:hypothetical protein HFD88_005624 [Aspergillus terreus]